MTAFPSTRSPEHGTMATVSQPTPSSPQRVASSPLRSSGKLFGSARAEPDGTVGCGAFPRTQVCGSRNLQSGTPLGRGLGPAAAGEEPHAHGASAAASGGTCDQAVRRFQPRRHRDWPYYSGENSVVRGGCSPTGAQHPTRGVAGGSHSTAISTHGHIISTTLRGQAGPASCTLGPAAPLRTQRGVGVVPAVA